MRGALLALLIGLAIASPASAQEAGTLEDAEQVFARWLKQHGVVRASLAVARGDRLVLAKGYGGLKPDSRVLLASLSKAITATCTATLIQQGVLRFDSPIGEVLDRGSKRYGTPRDARLGAVTVEQLLTHRSGFGRAAGDPATGVTLNEVLGRRAVVQATMYDLVPAILRHKLDHEPGTTYEYTNASHALLGIAIEAVTGRTHDDYCGEAVLQPHGIQHPTLHATWSVLGSFGGWSLSGAEYLAFLRSLGPAAPVLNDETRRWMIAPAGKETTPGGPVFYSLLFVRPVPGAGHTFYHFGSWGYRLSAGSPSGIVNASFGTLAASAPFGVSWFVSFEPRPSEDARSTMDRDLHRALRTIRTWPETNLYPSLGLR